MFMLLSVCVCSVVPVHIRYRSLVSDNQKKLVQCRPDPPSPSSTEPLLLCVSHRSGGGGVRITVGMHGSKPSSHLNPRRPPPHTPLRTRSVLRSAHHHLYTSLTYGQLVGARGSGNHRERERERQVKNLSERKNSASKLRKGKCQPTVNKAARATSVFVALSIFSVHHFHFSSVCLYLSLLLLKHSLSSPTVHLSPPSLPDSWQTGNVTAQTSASCTEGFIAAPLSLGILKYPEIIHIYQCVCVCV